MKVLWFSNSPAAAYSHPNKGSGGWMVALDHAVQQRVELHVAYKYPYKQKPFKNGETTYHPIYSGNIVLESIKRRFLPCYHKKLLNKYLEIVREVKPDIIHIHGSENDYHLIANKVDIPIVLSVQGNPTVIAHKYCVGFYGHYLRKKTGKITWQSFLLGRDSFQRGYHDLLWMSELENEDSLKIKNIIGRTDWDYRITRLLFPNSKYYYISEALRDKFYNCIWGNAAPHNRIIIHTTTGNSYYKGFETLCYALTILNRYGIDVEWRVAGVSKKSEINIITKKYLGKNYPQKGLVLLGSQDEDSLVVSLLSSHIYVMPSHIENSPNSLCEAMMLGMPCITTLAGGSDSILINKKEGLVIQDGDPWSMAGAILELKNNWEQACQYGKAAREHSLMRHNRNEIVNSLLDTYQEIIKDSKRQ